MWMKYSELLHACQNIGIAKNNAEATAFARVLDEAGVILLFRDKVYLHPDKVRFELFDWSPSLFPFSIFHLYMLSVGMEHVFVGLTIGTT